MSRRQNRKEELHVGAHIDDVKPGTEGFRLPGQKENISFYQLKAGDIFTPLGGGAQFQKIEEESVALGVPDAGFYNVLNLETQEKRFLNGHWQVIKQN